MTAKRKLPNKITTPSSSRESAEKNANAKNASKTSRRRASPRESKAALQHRIGVLLALLDAEYGGSRCSLSHRNPFELLVATILSAQCTDARVNMVTPMLFDSAPSPQALAALPIERIEELVRTTGFFRNKAKNIRGAAIRIVDTFGGQVPIDMDDLLSLPGVARKTANVVRGTAFGLATGVVVDTHVMRITKLLGLTKRSDPVRIEQDLIDLLPKEHWIRFTHQIIDHGRKVCIARRPRCSECLLANHCPSALGR